MDILDDFYYGNINPGERCFEYGTRYAKAVKSFCEAERKLEESLSGKEKEIFDALIDSNNEIISANDLENFKLGFRLGVKMMCSCFYGESVFKEIS